MKNAIKTKDAKKGGYLVGKPHSEGGIKGINVDTNEPIEVEGGEVVITKPAVESNHKYTFEGKQMTPKEILSKLNSDHGGVAFKEGGEISKHKFGDGGKFLGGDEDIEIFKKYYANKQVVASFRDDVYTIVYEAINASNYDKTLYITCKGVSNDTNDYALDECIFVGSFIFVKPFHNENRDRNLFQDVGNYYDEVIAKYGYNFYIPFQVKGFIYDTNNTAVIGIKLKRIINGEYNSFVFDLTEFASSDRLVVMPNPLVELPADFSTSEEIIYPQNIPNVINYADKIGQMCLIFEDKYTEIKTTQICEYLYPCSDGERVRTVNTGKSYNIRYAFCVNDSADIEFQAGETFFEVISYERNEDTYYNYIANETKILSAKDISKNNTNTLNIKLLGIKVQIGVSGDYNYQNLIFEYNGKVYVNYQTGATYGRSFRLLGEITKGEPEYRFVNVTISDLDKAIRKVRQKDTRDKVKYELLSKAAEAEISKYSILRGLVDKTNADKQVQIDRKLAELREAKDKYLLETDTGLELLNKLGNTFIQERLETETPDTSLMSINGVPTELTNKQWHKVRTDNFISWFGDWQMAYRTGNYGGVSKAINPRTKEPLVCYHGSRADFMAWRFSDFPAAYFADNRSYSQWFANLYGDGFMYQVFLDIKNPIDVMAFGIDAVPLRNIGDVLMNEYNIPREIALPNYDRYASAGIDQLNAFLDTPMQFWVYIRKFNTALLNYMREKTFYDGILMYEDNPQDIINGQKNVTGSYMVLRQEQIKWASAEHFNTQVENAGFAKGGILKEVNNKFNDDFFVL
jgi:hypothetical protein